VSGRVAVIVLVLLVLLFLLGVCGALVSGSGSASRDLPGGIAQGLGGFAVQPLDLDTVSTTCLRVDDQLVVGVNQTCTLSAPKAGPATRRLVVEQGTMQIDGPGFGGQPGVSGSPLPDPGVSGPVALNVLPDGGTYTIHCEPSVQCRLAPGR
jgi:hypothetical protein